jgi:hypothetical protein
VVVLTRPEKIISGGQTGADQAALAAAADLGIPTGGFAPKLFWTEDGPAPWLAERYGLVECASKYPAVRTRMNVEAADATVWVGKAPTPGSIATMRSVGETDARRARTGTRCLVKCNPEPAELREWVARHNIRVLNVAGNRASMNPGVAAQVRRLLLDAFGDAP